MPYLNGKFVKEEKIIPGKHKLIGRYRDPTFSTFYKGLLSNGPFDGVFCPCGAHSITREDIYKHWDSGCFDELVYGDA